MGPRSIGAQRKAKSSDQQSGVFSLKRVESSLGSGQQLPEEFHRFQRAAGFLRCLRKGWRGTASGAQTREVCQLSSSSGIY